MNKRRLIKASLWTTALSPFFFASCVDDSYDLTKDIDMTITWAETSAFRAAERKNSRWKKLWIWKTTA